MEFFLNYSEFFFYFFGISLHYSPVSLRTRPKCGVFRPNGLKIQNNLESIQRFFLNYSEFTFFFRNCFELLCRLPENVVKIIKNSDIFPPGKRSVLKKRYKPSGIASNSLKTTLLRRYTRIKFFHRQRLERPNKKRLFQMKNENNFPPKLTLKLEKLSLKTTLPDLVA